METKALAGTRRLALSAMLLALAYVLPFFTGNIPQVGNMLLPMHLPVLLCGFLCGGPWGAVVGFLAPLSRSFFIGMPKLYPNALAMAFELAAYGLISGLLSRRLPKTIWGTYLSLVGAMVGGRVVWGLVSWVLYTGMGAAFPLSVFWAGAVTSAIPGITLQLVAVPALVSAIRSLAGETL